LKKSRADNEAVPVARAGDGGEEGRRMGDEGESRTVSSGKAIDSTAWLTTVVPFWEASGLLSLESTPRIELADKMSVVKASKFLKVSNLPDDITLNEVCLMFRFAVNCLKVTLRRVESIAIVEFVDQVSAHIAMVTFNGFEICPSYSIRLEYYK
jgi:hypothetical protein